MYGRGFRQQLGGPYPAATRNIDVPGAHRKDPRIRPAPFNGSGHPLEHQAALLLDAVDAGSIPLEDAINELDALNIPPQLRQMRWQLQLTVTDTSTLLIPLNRRRMSFVIGNPDGGANATTIFFSYGALAKPLSSFGMPIAAQTTYQESNGSVTIDDIFVLADVLGAGQGFTNVIAYEGTLAIEGHYKR